MIHSQTDPHASFLSFSAWTEEVFTKSSEVKTPPGEREGIQITGKKESLIIVIRSNSGLQTWAGRRASAVET